MIGIPEHDDTGKFQLSCKDTKMASAHLIFQGALVARGRKYVGDRRGRSVAGGFQDELLFSSKPKQRKSNQSGIRFVNLVSFENI